MCKTINKNFRFTVLKFKIEKSIFKYCESVHI